jgi:YD repeat-containing protein
VSVGLGQPAEQNGQHQVLVATDAAGQATRCTYTASGQVLTVTNAKDETTTHTYDSEGRLQTVSGPVAGTTTTYEYDGYGRLPRHGSGRLLDHDRV